MASQPLQQIRWQTSLDLAPQFTGTSLFIHYASPMVTAANAVLIAVKSLAYSFRGESYTAPTPVGTYTGSAALRGGADEFALDGLNTGDFTVNVVPEPGTIGLIAGAQATLATKRVIGR